MPGTQVCVRFLGKSGRRTNRDAVFVASTLKKVLVSRVANQQLGDFFFK
jgi:hypothetical protein